MGGEGFLEDRFRARDRSGERWRARERAIRRGERGEKRVRGEWYGE